MKTNIKPIFHLIPSVLVISLIVNEGAFYANAQTPSCETSRLVRCQQELVRSLQVVDTNSASVQFQLSGPPYSPSRLVTGHAECKSVRANLECLLQTTPACYELNIPTSKNTDYIIRAKRFLEENNCNTDGTWRNSPCYRDVEIKRCEERFEPLLTNTNQYIANNIVNATCPFYARFKDCIDQHLRLRCRVHETDMVNEYLIDKTGEHAWRCLPNGTYYQPSQYVLNNAPGTYLQPSRYSGDYSSYDQKPIPTYVGSAGNLNLFQSSRDHAWERFRNPSFDDTRYGVGRYPYAGDVFDRLVMASNGLSSDGSDCAQRAAPYIRECEDNLLEQQRKARDSRDGVEMERKNCCALYHYRDCLARVVLDRCADSTTLAVDLLMGVRRRELNLSCRAPSRDICNGSLGQAILSLPTILLATIVSSYMTLKRLV